MQMHLVQAEFPSGKIPRRESKDCADAGNPFPNLKVDIVECLGHCCMLILIYGSVFYLICKVGVE